MTSLQNAAWILQDGLKAFDTRGITLTDDVLEAVAHWQEIRATIPAVPKPNALKLAIMAKADDAELGSALLGQLGGAQLAQAWTQAAAQCAADALDLIRLHRNEIHEQLARQAAEQIVHLQTVAAIGKETSLSELVRTGHPDAKLVATVETASAELSALYDIRDQVLLGDDARNLQVGIYNCGVWRNIADVAAHLLGSRAEQYLNGLRHNGILWYPDLDAARAAATPLQQAWEAEQRAVKAQQHGSGASFHAW